MDRKGAAFEQFVINRDNFWWDAVRLSTREKKEFFGSFLRF